jgi:hypothetical protein
VPKRKLGLKGKRCRPVKSIAPGETAVRGFKVRPKPAARGRRTKIRFTVNGPGVAKTRAVAVLKVKR